MGEYAEHKGQRVKIGTCEDMYYLRFDQRGEVRPLKGNVDPIFDAPALRFRFPWPDEDGLAPGADGFHANDFSRAINVPDFRAAGVDHDSIQFKADAGYLVSLPCPEGGDYENAANNQTATHKDYGLTVARNGFRGSVLLYAQKFVPDIGLVPVVRCGGCGSAWREQERPRIEEMATKFRAAADRPGHCGPAYLYHGIADRLLAGLEVVSAVA